MSLEGPLTRGVYAAEMERRDRYEEAVPQSVLKQSRGIPGSLTVLLSLPAFQLRAPGALGVGLCGPRPAASLPSSSSDGGRKRLPMPVGLFRKR